MSQDPRTPGAFDQFELYRLFSALQSPGLDTGNSWLNMGMGFFAQQGIFPQPQGNASIYDMMQLRSRNLDYHHIMGRAFASSQMMQRMGGINPNSPVFQALSPFLAQPDSMAWKIMAPLIGGNPVKAQMGLYADLSGQSMSTAGRMGMVTADETDRMMDQLNGRYYQKSDFGRYFNSIQDSLKTNLNDPAAFTRISQSGKWDKELLRSLENSGITGVNGELQSILKRTTGGMERLDKRDNLNQAQKDEEKEILRKRSQGEIDSLAAGITDPTTKSKITNALSEVLANPANFEKFASEFSTKKDAVYRQISRGIDMQEGKIPGGIDYRYTRGFAHEDITGAFGAAGRLNLLGRRTGLDVAGFGESSNRVLDAARGIFGRDLSGRELTTELSNLIGTGYANMGNDTDARKMEDLLRNVKGMARVAGVQISSMVGIIDEAKSLASAHGNIRGGISGFTASNIALEAMGNSSAAMGYMDPKFIRAMGGLPAFTSAQVRGQVEAIGSPVTQQLAALYAHFTGRDGVNSPMAKMIEEQAINGNNTIVGHTAFMNSLAERSGESVFALNMYSANNSFASQQGLEMNPRLKEAGMNANTQTFLLNMDQRLSAHSGFSKELFRLGNEPGELNKTDGDIIAGLRNQFKDLTPEQEAHALAVVRRGRAKKLRGEGAMAIRDVTSILGMSLNGQMESFIFNGGDAALGRYTSPTIRAEQDNYTSAASRSANVEKRIAEMYPMLNAGIAQRFLQSGLSGKLGDGGINELIAVLGGGVDVKNIAAMEGLSKKARALYSAATPTGQLVEKAAPGLLKSIIDVFAPEADVGGLTSALGKVSAADLRRLGKADAGPAKELAAKLKSDSGVNLTPEALIAAAKTFNKLDPLGIYDQDGDPRKLAHFLVTDSESRYRDAKGAEDTIAKIKRAESLLKLEDESTAEDKLKGLGLEGVNIDGIRGFMKRLNADTFENIGNAETPEEMERLARAALGGGATQADVASLVSAAKGLKILDPTSSLAGSKKSSKFNMVDLAGATAEKFSNDARSTLRGVQTHQLGTRSWDDVISNQNTPAAYLAALNDIKKNFLDNDGDMAAAADAMKTGSAKKAGIEKILRDKAIAIGADPDTFVNRFTTDTMAAAKEVTDTDVPTGKEAGLGGLLGGIQQAIGDLTSVIRSVSN